MILYLSRLLQSQYFQYLYPIVDILLCISMPIFNIIKRICWEIYLLFTRLPPTQAWMDPREQALIVKYIQRLKQQRR